MGIKAQYYMLYTCVDSTLQGAASHGTNFIYSSVSPDYCHDVVNASGPAHLCIMLIHIQETPFNCELLSQQEHIWHEHLPGKKRLSLWTFSLQSLQSLLILC